MILAFENTLKIADDDDYIQSLFLIIFTLFGASISEIIAYYVHQLSTRHDETISGAFQQDKWSRIHTSHTSHTHTHTHTFTVMFSLAAQTLSLR